MMIELKGNCGTMFAIPVQNGMNDVHIFQGSPGIAYSFLKPGQGED
jgi:hypothetical protein